MLNQSYENWIHIIVNDGGNKNTLEDLTNKYADRYRDRLKIIHNSTSLGTASALNVGMRELKTDYVITHDDDDSWEPEFLEKSIRTLNAQKVQIANTRGVVCHTTAIIECIDGDQVLERYRYSFNGWVKSISLTRLAAGNFIPPISFLFEREIFSKIGFFNEALYYAEDWEFYLRLLSKYEIAVLPEHLANYHTRTDAKDAYANTVTLGIDKHSLAAAAIRNDLIRQDLASGRFGLGYLVALSSRGPLTGNLKHMLWRIRKEKLAAWNIKAVLRHIQVLFRKKHS